MYIYVYILYIDFRGEEVEKKIDLVIPMKPNTMVTAERLQQIAEEVESAVHEIGVPTQPSTSNKPLEPAPNETLDQMAERELLQEAQKDSKAEAPKLVVPMTKNNLEGEKEVKNTIL